jgi:hypothetical protein
MMMRGERVVVAVLVILSTTPAQQVAIASDRGQAAVGWARQAGDGGRGLC